MLPFSTTMDAPQTASQMRISTKTENWRPLLVSLVASSIAMVFVFRQIEIRQFFDHLVQAKVLPVILMTSVYVVVILVRAWRWYTLTGGSLTLKQSAVVVNIGYLMNTIWPFRVGEVARIELTRRSSEHSFGDSVASLVVERLIDLCFAVLFTIIGLILLPQHPERLLDYIPIKPFFISILFIGTIVIITARHKMLGDFSERLQKIRQWHPILSTIWRHGEQFLGSLQRIRDSKRLSHTIILSIFLWLLYLLYYQIGLQTFGVHNSSVGMGLLIVGFAALGIAAPSLPGAIGIFHAAVVLALSLHGQDITLATSYAWLVWIPQTVVIIMSGLISLWFSQSLWKGSLRLPEMAVLSSNGEATTNAN